MALESTRISTSNCPSLAGSTIDPPFNVSDGTGTKQISHSAERFLQQKRLVPLQGFELDSLRTCRIALLFCLPVLELGLEWLDGFHEVLIYPAPFVVDDEWEDDIGLVHNQRIVQSGQSSAARAYRFELVGYTRFF
ncbi:zinc-dependent peptidase [Escherichia coli]